MIEDEQYGQVVQLTGDQRENLRKFLVEVGIAKNEAIVVHGF